MVEEKIGLRDTLETNAEEKKNMFVSPQHAMMAGVFFMITYYDPYQEASPIIYVSLLGDICLELWRWITQLLLRIKEKSGDEDFKVLKIRPKNMEEAKDSEKRYHRRIEPYVNILNAAYIGK